MGILDAIKDAFDGDDSNDPELVKKGREYVDEHQEQVDGAIDKAGDVIDQRTGGRFAEQVEKGQEFAKDKIGDL